MTEIHDKVENWVAEARRKLAAGTLGAADFDALLVQIESRGRLRQRLLYLHAVGINTHHAVVAMEYREPTRIANTTWLSPTPDFPYATVHDAIVDGWRVIQFPRHPENPEDREIATIGHEFILEKLEYYND